MQLTRYQQGKLQSGQHGLGLSPSLMGLQEEASLSLYPNQGHKTQPLCRATGWFWPKSEFWNQLPVFFHKDMHFFVSGTTNRICAWGANGLKGPFWVDGTCLRKCGGNEEGDGGVRRGAHLLLTDIPKIHLHVEQLLQNTY